MAGAVARARVAEAAHNGKQAMNRRYTSRQWRSRIRLKIRLASLIFTWLLVLPPSIKAQTRFNYDAGGNLTEVAAAVFGPPTITAQPSSQGADNGDSASFSVVATGSGPFNYQWYNNGALIPGATNATLFLSNVTVANQSYTVSVCNSYGCVTSTAPALLQSNWTWVAAGAADWHSASSWNPPQVPSGPANIIIPQGAIISPSAPITVTGRLTFSGAATVSGGSLTIASGGEMDVNGPVTFSTVVNVAGSVKIGGTASFVGTSVNFVGNSSLLGGTLSLANGTANFNSTGLLAPGAMNVTGGVLGGNQPVRVSGPLNWTGGTIIGTVQFNGGSFSGSSLYLYGGQLFNFGTLAWNGFVNAGYESVISNAVGATINLAANDLAADTVAGSTSHTDYNAGQIIVSGTGRATIGGTFVNTGSVSINSGTLALTGRSSVDGDVAVAAGGTLNLSLGNNTFNPGSSISGAGNLTVSSGTANFRGNLAATGVWTFSSGTVNITGPDGASGQTITIAGGTVNFNGTGTLAPAALNVLAAGGNSVLDGSQPILVNGPLNWTGGFILGTVRFNGGNFSGGLYLSGGQLLNFGTLAWDGVVTAGSGSVISNAAGATINLAANDSAADLFTGVASHTDYNAGQIIVSGTGRATIGGTFINTGSVGINSGTLALAGGSTADGTFTVGAGGTLNLAGGNHTFNPGSTVSGAGKLTVSTGTANLRGTLAATGVWTFSSGTANITGSDGVSGHTITVSGGTVNFNGTGTLAPAALNVLSAPGTSVLGGGQTILVNGPLNWTGGFIMGTVRFSGGTFSGGLYLSGGQLLNFGTLAWDGVVTAGSGSVISNAAGATINLAANDSAADTFTGVASHTDYNAGQIIVSGTGRATIGGTFINTGSVAINSGTLALAGGSTADGTFTVAAGGTLNLAGGNHTFNPGSTVSGAGKLTVSSGTANLRGNLAATGVWTFSSGTANITGSDGVSGHTITVSGGTVNFNGTGTLAPAALNVLSAPGTSVLGGGQTILVNGPLSWTAGFIMGTVRFNGGTFSGNPLYLPGGQLLNFGTLSWNALINAGLDSVISNAVGGTINLAADGVTSDILAYSGSHTDYNAGNLVVSGTGMASIAGTFVNTGTMKVESGTLRLGGMTSMTSGNIDFGINGPTDYGRVTFVGIPILAGGLKAHLGDGYLPLPGTTFTLVSYPSRSGVFSPITLPPSASWQTNYAGTFFTLTALGSNLILIPSVNSSGYFVMQFAGNTNNTYTVFSSTNLALPVSNWVTLGAPSIVSNSLYQFVDTHSVDFPRRFYILRSP